MTDLRKQRTTLVIYLADFNKLQHIELINTVLG